jgi:hypothetical protein
VLPDHSAAVSAAPLGERLIECAYSGVITRATMPQAHRRALSLIMGASAAVARTDTAVFTIDRLPLIPHDLYREFSVPVALVVTPDRYEFWHEVADLLEREAGQVRAVFLQNRLEMARRWAEDQALAIRPRLPAWHA